MVRRLGWFDCHSPLHIVLQPASNYVHVLARRVGARKEETSTTVDFSHTARLLLCGHDSITEGADVMLATCILATCVYQRGLFGLGDLRDRSTY